MKYYLYVSKTKVNMLYPGIPPNILKRISTEVKANFGVVSTTVKASEPGSADDLYIRTAILTRYIKAHKNVGSIEDPKQYITGTLPLRRGNLEDYSSNLAFFGNRFEQTTLALIGSTGSLVGAPIRAEESHTIDYYELSYLNALLDAHSRHDEDVISEVDEVDPWYWLTARDAIDELPQRTQTLDFLARLLHFEERNGQRLVVATPIYVALADSD